MQRAMNYVRGAVRVEVTCEYPERFVNLCAMNGVEFWGMERGPGNTLRTHMRVSGFRTLAGLSDGAGFSLRQIKRSGAPVFLRRMRKRYVLLAGLIAVFLLTRALALFVWEIDVIGNVNVPESVILENLRDLGVSQGSFGPKANSEALSNEMLLRIPELSWFAVNIRGSHADVLVRERIPVPEIVDERRPTMVCASKSGVVTSVVVLSGARVCTVGDTVQAGDILVSGIVDGAFGGRRTVHAMAEVYARTWYEMSSQMPLETHARQGAGEAKTRRSLVIAGNTINLYFNAGILWSNYDKIITEKTVKLPLGSIAPLTLVTERVTRYEPIPVKLTVAAAEGILQAGLTERLRGEISGGEIIASSFETRVSGGTVTVTLRAECKEQIARARDFTDGESAY
jgi:similar to stage IV sporulation protein